MLTKDGFHYAIQILRADGTGAGQQAAPVDWAPAREWVRWLAVRRGIAPAEAFLAEARIDPVWAADRGAPFLAGVAVEALGANGGEAVLPIEYFGDAAQTIARAMVAEERLADGEVFRYLPLAFAQADEAPGAKHSSAKAPDIAIAAGLPAEVADRASLEGEHDPDDARVLIPDEVLEEAAELTLAHSGVETGGVLIGRLRRDDPFADVYLEVTAQIPARHTEGSVTKLTFTPETWSDVRAAIALRRQGEIQLGSWHSHPVKAMCRCPEEKRPNGCPLGRGFFSADDRVLHRTVFSRAFNVGLVVSDIHDAPPTFALFGWRRGLIERRGFHRIGAWSDANAG